MLLQNLWQQRVKAFICENVYMRLVIYVQNSFASHLLSINCWKGHHDGLQDRTHEPYNFANARTVMERTREILRFKFLSAPLKSCIWCWIWLWHFKDWQTKASKHDNISAFGPVNYLILLSKHLIFGKGNKHLVQLGSNDLGILPDIELF